MTGMHFQSLQPKITNKEQNNSKLSTSIRTIQTWPCKRSKERDNKSETSRNKIHGIKFLKLLQTKYSTTYTAIGKLFKLWVKSWFTEVSKSSETRPIPYCWAKKVRSYKHF